MIEEEFIEELLSLNAELLELNKQAAELESVIAHNIRQLTGDSKVEGTVFEALREADFFARVDVQMGAVHWPNDADLAPDAMYDAIRQDGHWIV